MKLEDAIKQSKWESVQQRAWIELVYTSSLVNAESAVFFGNWDLSAQQYNVLRILKGSHPTQLKVADIKSRMLDRTPNMTRLVDKLLLRKFVSRNPCKIDRRKIYIGITEKGTHLVDQIQPENDKKVKKLKSNLSEKDALALGKLLEKFRDSFLQDQ